MNSNMYKQGLTVLYSFLVMLIAVDAWNGHEAVLLKDISVLTLHNGKMTTSRRSDPVPQLKCVGGTAGCGSFVPQVVQCYNRGSDGFDVQWECKTDMDNAYRFGKVEVTCEGFNYPDDPYVLKGSCGLEYTLDLTKEGEQQKRNTGYQSHHNYYQDDYYGNSHAHKKSSSWTGDLLVLVVIGVVIYAIYATCIAPRNNNQGQGDPPPYGAHDDHSRPRGNPPPYGFRNDYMPDDNDADCHRNRANTTNYGNTGASNGTGSSGGGFWTGAGLGGMLGYMFGSRTNTGYGYGPSHGYGPSYTYGPSYNRGGWFGNRGWGGSSFFSSRPSHTSSGFGFSSGGGGGGGSTGTRTASGFGGTRRR